MCSCGQERAPVLAETPVVPDEETERFFVLDYVRESTEFLVEHVVRYIVVDAGYLSNDNRSVSGPEAVVHTCWQTDALTRFQGYGASGGDGSKAGIDDDLDVFSSQPAVWRGWVEAKHETASRAIDDVLLFAAMQVEGRHLIDVDVQELLPVDLSTTIGLILERAIAERYETGPQVAVVPNPEVRDIPTQASVEDLTDLGSLGGLVRRRPSSEWWKLPPRLGERGCSGRNSCVDF